MLLMLTKNLIFRTLYSPSYRQPSLGAYLLCLANFSVRMTRIGFPFFQSLAFAPFSLSTLASQLTAIAKFVLVSS